MLIDDDDDAKNILMPPNLTSTVFASQNPHLDSISQVTSRMGGGIPKIIWPHPHDSGLTV